MFLLTSLKALLFIKKMKNEAKLRNFFSLNFQRLQNEIWSQVKELFSLNFQWLQHDIWQFWGIRDPLKQNLVLQFCRNWNKDVSILTGTHISLDQIHHKRNNWLGAIFFSPAEKIVTWKDCLSCYIWVLKLSLRLTLIQKGGLCHLRLMTEFSVFMLWA